MILDLLAGILVLAVVLAIASAIGAAWIERRHPPTGRFIEVAGGRLHILELGEATDTLPVVLLHGASGNLQDMRLSLGERLARNHRVVLIDRPGHGWSGRPGGDADAALARQAALIAQVLDRLGIARAIILGHSFAGAVVTAFALSFPQRVAALALLAPATHPWSGGIAWFYTVASLPFVGPLFARTIVLPVALPVLERLCVSVFAPQPMPERYADRAAIALLLRPSAFVANARDVAQLLADVTRQSPRYAEIAAPTVIITGDRDTIVSPTIHSKALAAALRHAKLIVLEGVGHAVQHVAADRVVAEVEQLAARSTLSRQT
ncbi:MAG: alpha/beta fold hydrolase [Alphaproteobacteria bacterium]|nr:alpha/beta fold hydrolase [Alphaproteobacteria bacterium]